MTDRKSNINSRKKLEEKAVLNSLALLNEKDEIRLMDDIKKLPVTSKNIFAECNDLVSLLTKAAFQNIAQKDPSPELKNKILSKIRSDKSTDVNSKGFGFIHADSGEWMQHPHVKGIKVKQLAFNEKKDYVMILLKVEPGTEYPPHKHNGAEECFVIEGDVYAQGRVLGPGDFHHADDRTEHEPLYTKNGCTLLLVVDPKDL